jgi:hypothetical protein
MITDFTAALREPRTLPSKAAGKLPLVGSGDDEGGER